MNGHDFIEAPGKRVEIGFNPHETVMMLRCRWCNNTPSKARTDGCPMHEIAAVGHIVLSEYNPDGLERFANRDCVTCDKPIMDHWLRRDSREYWCPGQGEQSSEGIANTIWDVPDEVRSKY